MESQAAFVLFAFLYLASPLATVQAVTYHGDPIVNEGQSWEIECRGVKPEEKINWTKNGQPLEELSSGDLMIRKTASTASVHLRAEHATEMHEGNYRCTPNGNESFHLTVKSVTTIKVLAEGDVPLFIACDDYTDKTAEWQKEGINVRTKFEGKSDIINVNSNNGSLEILKADPSVYGNYSCNSTSTGNASVLYRVVPKPIVILQESITVVENEKLHLICLGNQKPGVKIAWTFGGKTYNTTEGRVKLSRDKERGINRAVLDVEGVQMSERGNVTCHVSYDWSDETPGHYAKADTLLRVKDKLAALWPFLGICAEVVVLCAIILIYEKKRNKAELEESDTDQSPDTGDLFNGDDSESSFVPLRGPLPPSDLPVRPPVTPPRPSSPIYKTVQFRSPSREPRRNSPLRSAPPSPTGNDTNR